MRGFVDTPLISLSHLRRLIFIPQGSSILECIVLISHDHHDQELRTSSRGFFSQISTSHDLIKEIEAAADVALGYSSSEMIIFPKKTVEKMGNSSYDNRSVHLTGGVDQKVFCPCFLVFRTLIASRSADDVLKRR
ncbi:hypothetical protein [Bacillus swezeyi]|uniref:hypothetical protein n=1 Tax=Bacillus swezeyi TaxID=1925020 RepID=UPI001239661F|nr:hypothetical protein [Bacillus swezeyi]